MDAIISNINPEIILVSFILILIVYLYHQAYSTDIPWIKGIPEAPGSIPFYGHLTTLGNDHPSKFEEWRYEHGWPVVQAKLGNRRIVVLNGFDAARQWVLRNATATIDRPLFYTFHTILSSTQGSTIGAAPWNESTKRCRTAVGACITRPAIQKSAPMLDLETFVLVHDLFLASKHIYQDVDPRIFFQRQAVNITLMICYGTRFTSINNPSLHGILDIAGRVSTFRSTNNNPQDFVPILRYLPGCSRNKTAVETRNRRDKLLDSLLNSIQTALDKNIAGQNISEGLLRDTEDSKLSKDDIRSINVSLISGGFETVATTSTAGMAALITPSGEEIQEKAYEDLLSVYGTAEDAWEQCVTDERSPYLVALVREMLRYFAAVPLLPPRQTERKFSWNGVEVPKGVSVFLNAQAINHDKETYGPDADVFRPERWLDPSAAPPPYHFSFGAGSRACPATAVSNRLLYTTFARLILGFKLRISERGPVPDTGYVSYNRDPTMLTAVPKPYKVKLIPRAPDGRFLDRCFDQSRQRKDEMGLSEI
ncbi:phenylacetate 2-hydroxylase [Xylogone sp. PMI_703]|nr:phenylacetate 2-hydroxylase [Xylogone sp. PMI_703]